MTGARARGARLAGSVAVAALTTLFAAVPAAVPAHAAAASGTGQAKLAVLDLVVLVDESGSETPQKVADEKATAGTIVQSLLNPASRVTVIGFGGVNRVTPGQVPTDVACVPTIASGAANLDYLSTCVSKLHQRTEAEGDDTDYAAALGQAMSYLSPGSTATPPSPAGAIKVIMMMTDGAVDVHRNTQQYGANWQLGEQTAISQQLAAAKAGGVQFWPLGFGTDIGNVNGTSITEAAALSYLNKMAAAAASSVCGTRRTAVQPHATWVNNPDDAINALDQLYADASCSGVNSSTGSLGGGINTATLTVTIPEIASAAAISVARGNPGVSVSFQPPSGPVLSGSADVTGQGSAVEVLHLNQITESDVGTWHIHLTAPPGLASELVRATAFWQGAVRALTTVTPPSAKLGQQVKVTLDVLGPNGPISDPGTLSSMFVGETVTGGGLAGTVGIPVAAVSGAPGEWSGSYTVPSQPTTLTFTGTAAGYGLYATQVSATVGVGSQTQGLNATPQFTGTSVQAGGTIHGQVVLTNQTGSAQHVKLVVSVVSGPSGATAVLSSPVGPFTVAPGSPPSQPFTVTVGQDSPTGVALVQVEAVNAATGQVISAPQQDFTITKPPGFWAKYQWDILGLIALLVLAALALAARWKVSRDRRDVRHLVAMLRRGGTELGRPLEPGDKWAEVFPFVIRDDVTQLDHPQRAASAGIYQVRRAGRGLVRLTTPTGLRPYEVEVGGPGLRMDNGLELAFRDTRHPEWAGSGKDLVTTAADWSGSGTANGQGGAGHATAHDDWSGSGGWGGSVDWSGSGAPTITTTPPTVPQPPPDNGQGTTPTIPVRPTPPAGPPATPQPQDPWL